MVALDSSPLKFVSESDTRSYARNKLRRVRHAYKVVLSEALQMPIQSLTSLSSKSDKDCTECDEMIEKLKDKYAKSCRNEKIRILTLVPDSWTIDRTVSEFGVSHRMVKA